MEISAFIPKSKSLITANLLESFLFDKLTDGDMHPRKTSLQHDNPCQAYKDPRS